LTHETEVFGQIGVTRRQGEGGTLAMDAQKATFSVNLVILKLGEIVRHVVDKGEITSPDGTLKGSADSERQRLTVGPAVVGSRGHGTQVRLTFG